jgi:ribonuclease P protein component
VDATDSSSEQHHEANLSAKQAQASPHPRLPRQERDPKRPQGTRGSAGQGARTPHPLKDVADHPALSTGRSAAGFPPELRLRDAAAFRRVFAKPTRFGGSGFLILARTGRCDGPRLGLAISKRCANRAVDRNRLKRIVRESFRLRASQLPAVDVVVLCTRDARKLPSVRLRQTLEQAWERIRSSRWDEP